MKKVLSLMMMLMLAIGAWAGEVTFTPGTVSGSTTDTSADEMTSGGITFSSTSAALARTDNYRFYGSGTTTVTSTVGNITKIVFTCNNENYASTMSDASFSAGSVSSSENIVTWTGDASSFTFKPSAQVRVDLIVVTYTEGTAPAVATPVIAGETPFTESTEVTITCATYGASIYYTTDGSEPTSQSTAYTAAFTLTETTTVKAIAYDATGAASSVATKTFEKEEGPASCATVAEINALADNTEFTFTGRLVVSGHAHATSGSNNWLYAQDATGGTLMYKATQDYQKGDVIPAGFTGTKATYGGVPQVKDLANMQPATETEELVAEELTPSHISSENVYRYAVIKGATVNDNNIVVGEESVVIYNNRFNTEIPADENTYDVYGITSSFNGTPQFMPLEFVAQATEVATPVIAGETPFTESTEVTITCETEGASIYYTIDGSEPTSQSTAYTAPFSLTESATVKAIAFNEAEDCSPIVSKEFVKTLTVATAAEYLALEDGTEFVFTGNLVVSGQAGQRLYAQDETGGVLIYGNAGQTYKFGDVIPAGFSAKKANYNGTIEMTNMSGMQAATETAELVAKEVAIADYVDNQNVYVVVKNATIDGTTLVVGEETLATYNRFGVDYPTDDKAYDVYGVATIYNNASQLHPISFVEYQEPVVESFISYTAQQERGTVAVTLEDGTAVESLVTKVAEGTKFTVTATAAQGYMVTNIEVKAGEIVITPTTDPYDGEFSAPALKAEGAREMSQTFEMPADDVAITVTFDTRTGIENINMDNVKAVRFFNAAGVESATPFQGVNIVVREMNDGSKVVTKMVK